MNLWDVVDGLAGDAISFSLAVIVNKKQFSTEYLSRVEVKREVNKWITTTFYNC
mgnify:CR=1 FL=1